MKYSIYQLKGNEAGHNLLYKPFDEIGHPDINNYEKVYSGENENINDVKDVVKEFNNVLPPGFYGHPVTTSDIVICDDCAWYVDVKGYKALSSDFLK